jgi:hypothetical protein
VQMDGVARRSRTVVLAAVVALGTLALLAPTGAQAAKKKLKVRVATSSQAQAANQGALRVSYKAKGLTKVTVTAKATPGGGSAVNFARKASKSNPRSGTLRLPLTAAGEAALEQCASLAVNVAAKGKPSKSARRGRPSPRTTPGARSRCGSSTS